MFNRNEIEATFGGRTLAQMIGITGVDAVNIAEKGCDLLEAGAFDEAQHVFEGLVVLNPRDGATWASLGVVYEKQGRAADAKSAWATSLELDPSNKLARERLAQREEPKRGAK
ncbi:MAG: tetratricopeptide repeat protein [Deltaproteobacteria bacterium]|nr:tetratricopeptide repeat protein [Deltaproteobacteria bacterium]